MIEFHPEARLDLLNATSWYRDVNRDLAKRFKAEVNRAVEMILLMPDAWPKYLLGTRRFLLNRFPYSVVYRKAQESIQILAVAHERRSMDYWVERI